MYFMANVRGWRKPLPPICAPGVRLEDGGVLFWRLYIFKNTGARTIKARVVSPYVDQEVRLVWPEELRTNKQVEGVRIIADKDEYGNLTNEPFLLEYA